MNFYIKWRRAMTLSDKKTYEVIFFSNQNERKTALIIKAISVLDALEILKKSLERIAIKDLKIINKYSDKRRSYEPKLFKTAGGMNVCLVCREVHEQVLDKYFGFWANDVQTDFISKVSSQENALIVFTIFLKRMRQGDANHIERQYGPIVQNGEVSSFSYCDIDVTITADSIVP
jgi:hypothetical protein